VACHRITRSHGTKHRSRLCSSLLCRIMASSGAGHLKKQYRSELQAVHEMSPSQDHETGGSEFLRRYLLHVVPAGIHRIHHHGLSASITRKDSLAQAPELLASRETEVTMIWIKPVSKYDSVGICRVPSPAPCSCAAMNKPRHNKNISSLRRLHGCRR